MELPETLHTKTSGMYVYMHIRRQHTTASGQPQYDTIKGVRDPCVCGPPAMTDKEAVCVGVRLRPFVAYEQGQQQPLAQGTPSWDELMNS